jgi:hypothetical protein
MFFFTVLYSSGAQRLFYHTVLHFQAKTLTLMHTWHFIDSQTHTMDFNRHNMVTILVLKIPLCI